MCKPEIREALQQTEGIKHVQTFSTKPGIIKTDSAFQGIILKGVGKDYDWDFFRQNMVDGSIINPDDTVHKNQPYSPKI